MTLAAPRKYKSATFVADLHAWTLSKEGGQELGKGK
jgi:hypothetical protein